MQSRRSARAVRPAQALWHAGARLVVVVAVGCALLGSGVPLLAQATAVRVTPDGANGQPSVQRSSSGRGYGPPGSLGRDVSNAPIPPKYAPPGGMCRVWVQGVPPAQQPAPTQCAKAVRVHSPNSQVVFGPSRSGTAVSSPQPHPGVVNVGGEHVGTGSAPVARPDAVGESGPAATTGPEPPPKDRVNTGSHGSTTQHNAPPPHIPHIAARPHR
jgi:hypothetical protein